MKAKYAFVLCLLFAACGPPADITVKLEKKSAGMMIKSATFSVGESRDLSGGREFRPYTFLLTNFDPAGKDLDAYGPDLTSTEQIKIHFNLVVDSSDDNKEMKLKTGSFKGASSNYGDKGITINSFRVFTFADGSEQVFARMGSNQDSFVKLTSVTDDTVSGEIAFVDGKESVTGKFTAKMIKKKDN